MCVFVTLSWNSFTVLNLPFGLVAFAWQIGIIAGTPPSARLSELKPGGDRIQAYQPYAESRIAFDEALRRCEVPMREFMLKQTRLFE